MFTLENGNYLIKGYMDKSKAKDNTHFFVRMNTKVTGIKVTAKEKEGKFLI